MVANKIAFIGRVTRSLELQTASKGTGKNKVEWSYAYGTIAVRKNKDEAWFIPFKASPFKSAITSFLYNLSKFPKQCLSITFSTIFRVNEKIFKVHIDICNVS